MAYSNKVGAGSQTSPREKLEKVIEQFNNIRPYVTGIQANFIFGLDEDSGDEPTELTKEFARRAPFVMPNFNIPVPFGNTPLYDRALSLAQLHREWLLCPCDPSDDGWPSGRFHMNKNF